MVANELLIRRLFDAFGRRDLDEAVALFDREAVFHVPGQSEISGTYRGHDGVLDYWHRQIELSADSFRTKVVSLESEDDRVVVSVDVSAERDGRRTTWQRIVVYRIDGGKIVDASVTESDQAAADTVFARRD
jgi:ketosteroid isomerase-like protein